MIADTSFLVDLLRGVPETAETLRRLDADGTTLWIPTPVLFELWEGVERGDRPHEEAAKIQKVTAGYTVLPFDARHAQQAGRLSGDLMRRGRMIEPIDAQIAGMALAEATAVLTRNRKDFERVPGLKVVAY